jgi:RNA polymerase sigma factor (TIGR02999 family)
LDAVDPQGEVTSLLVAWGKGDQNALKELMPLVYNELHRMARRAWSVQDQGNTLQPTALINEAYLRLADVENASFQNRCHFFAVACTAMRQILVNHARSRLAGKRGSGRVSVSLDDVQLAVHQEAAQVVALHDALERLQAVDERKSRVIEMRYFGGLSIEETAEALGVSIITVNRDFRLARTWLMREMNGEQP